ncbi:MAG TPA: hypothetical protein VNZ26_29870 [Vicinamibacterales bacterium]|nr:hypothetical protein [Vicinamibacterales bacterium]
MASFISTSVMLRSGHPQANPTVAQDPLHLVEGSAATITAVQDSLAAH